MFRLSLHANQLSGLGEKNKNKNKNQADEFG